jgi:hypothetical protein
VVCERTSRAAEKKLPKIVGWLALNKARSFGKN